MYYVNVLVDADKNIYLGPEAKEGVPELKIDLATGKLEIDGKDLDYLQRVDVSGSDNIFNSSWSGFQWGQKEGQGTSEIFIGRLSANGRIYIRIYNTDSSGKPVKILLLSDRAV